MNLAIPSAGRRHGLAVCAASLFWPLRLSAATQRRDWPAARATPAVQLPRLDGGVWNATEARGRPVLLNFWASWCEPCRQEMPSLQSLAARHAAAGLEVLAVNYREPDATVHRFVSSTALTLPVLCDRDGAVAKTLAVSIFPSTVAIDRRGRVSFTAVGELDWNGPLADRWLAELL